jgi:hypothetical protein
LVRGEKGIMNDFMRFLLPSAQATVVEESEKLKISGHWKIECDCPSNTLFSHIHHLLTKIEEKIDDFDFSIEKKGDADVCEDFIYPIGCITDSSPYTIKMMMESLDRSTDENIIIPVWANAFSTDDYCSTDEYILKGSSKNILICSRTERGLFYGLKTLEQLLFLTDYSLFSLEIKDTPKLALRAIHLDLKFIRPPLEYLKKLIQTLAYYKINAVIIEWEDKYPFTGDLEFIRHPGALTEKEKDELLDTCVHFYIELIPLIQSLGHTDYILKHPNLRHLREKPKTQSGSYEMFCPSHPESKSTIWKIQEQIINGMGVHKQSKYIHLGLDECYYLGQCDSCNEYLNTTKKTKSELIVDWINAFAEKYLAMGKKPIIWHDMLVRHPEAIDRLNKQIIICDWEYEQPVPRDQLNQLIPKEIDPTGKTVNFIRGWEIITQDIFEKRKPVIYDTFYESCWKANGGKYHFNSFPYTMFFKSKGFEVITAPSSQSARITPAGSLYEIHFPNIMYFNQKAIEQKCIGSICTNWVVRKAIFPLVQHEFVLHAATCWYGKRYEEQEFDKAFWMNFYGLSLDSHNLSIVEQLNGFFTNCTRFGREFPKLIEWARLDKENSEEMTIIERYKPILYKMDLVINIHQDQFDYIQQYFEYWVFLSQFIHLVIEVEEFLYLLDEKEKIDDSDLSRMIILQERLEKEKKVWEPIRIELKHLYTAIINPFEVKDYEFSLIEPISAFFDLMLSKKIDTQGDLRFLVDNFIENKIKMSKF